MYNVCTRFKNRIVEMVHDKEENVAVQAVKLISFMLNSFDVLENSDCEVNTCVEKHDVRNVARLRKLYSIV